MHLQPATVAGPRARGPARWPWWAQVLGVYAVSRLISALALLLALQLQPDTPARWWGRGSPPYPVFVARWWDGWWYSQIAAQGYPPQLPLRHQDGQVALNAWAFFPLYPTVVRGLQQVTGLSWDVLAPAVSLLAGAVAMLLVHACLRLGAPRAVAVHPRLPLAGVAVLSVFPSSVVLSTGYTESLALLLLAAALLLVLRHRYLLAVLPVVALGFTRAVALPLVVVVLVHALSRWAREGPANRRRLPAVLARRLPVRDGGPPVPVRDLTRLALLAVATGLSGLAWPAVAGWVTGVPDAYLRTQEAWRRPRPVTPLGGWTRLATFGWPELAVTALVLGLLVALLVSRSARRLGPELLAWSWAHLVYLALVVDLISSVFRFLLLAFPLAAVAAGLVGRSARAHRVWLASLLVALVGLQVAWTVTVWVYVVGEVSFLRAP